MQFIISSIPYIAYSATLGSAIFFGFRFGNAPLSQLPEWPVVKAEIFSRQLPFYFAGSAILRLVLNSLRDEVIPRVIEKPRNEFHELEPTSNQIVLPPLLISQRALLLASVMVFSCIFGWESAAIIYKLMGRVYPY